MVAVTGKARRRSPLVISNSATTALEVTVIDRTDPTKMPRYVTGERSASPDASLNSAVNPHSLDPNRTPRIHIPVATKPTNPPRTVNPTMASRTLRRMLISAPQAAWVRAGYPS